MGGARPFREAGAAMAPAVDLRQALSDNARSALSIVTMHLNGHTEMAWPSSQTIADATDKNVNTIPRAVRELEIKGIRSPARKWPRAQHGISSLSDVDIRRIRRPRNDGQVVTIYPSEDSHIRPVGRAM
ncbi:helix-turn-helix domain-containing protein [Rhizobium anhuiense]|uniref:helix-turn-helix domain-containing protein n=1 Tax=Rhizobium anhuiense TaxID=1184720 RepID=UPI00315A893B